MRWEQTERSEFVIFMLFELSRYVIRVKQERFKRDLDTHRKTHITVMLMSLVLSIS